MPGFFETYTDTGGLNWIGKDEKDVLITEKVAFPVLGVTYSKGGKYGDQYVVVTKLEDEDRALGFKAGTVQSRDAMLEAMQAYLAGPADEVETPYVFLERAEGSNAVLIREAV